MHDEVMQFCRVVVQQYRDPMRRVLDVGSFNMNGTTRGLFPSDATYVGIDVHAGPGVDWVGPAHEFPATGWDGRFFDVMVSTECLEHDRHWAQTLRACSQVVRPGGLVVLTCATGRRAPHALEIWPDGYYRNLGAEEVLGALRGGAVSATAQVVRGQMDLQVWGTRDGPLECLDATGYDYDMQQVEEDVCTLRLLKPIGDNDPSFVARTWSDAAEEALVWLAARRLLARPTCP